MSWCGFFEFILFMICSVSWIYRFMSFAKFGENFQFLLVWILSSSIPFSFPSGEFVTWMLDFLLLFLIEALLKFFPFVSSVIQIGWFLLFYLQVHYLFPLSTTFSLWVHPLSFYFGCYIFSSSKISAWFFWFLCFSCAHSCSLKGFDDGGFKTLVGSFTAHVIMRMVSVDYFSC